jgi:serine/threonine protein kinase
MNSFVLPGKKMQKVCEKNRAPPPDQFNLSQFYVRRGKLIGTGGFSKVYELDIYPFDPGAGNLATLHQFSTKEPGRKGALKYVFPSTHSGLESLMELYIMRHISTPTLNRALNAQIDQLGHVSIIQDLALGDAATYIRKLGHRLSPHDLKRWLWQIACGVAHLHRHGILHGDIKAGNILLFPSEDSTQTTQSTALTTRDLAGINCRVNDFSLSRLIMDPDIGTSDTGRHKSYTSTHRPIEVWQGLNYAFPADIWALGCACYEIAYGRLLFSEQNTVHKALEIEANSAAFQAWSQAALQPRPRSPHSGAQAADRLASEPCPEMVTSQILPRPGLNFKSFNLAPEWWHSENLMLNDLLLGMLTINPHHRLTIWEVLNHDYFTTTNGSPRYLNSLNLLAPTDREFPVVRYVNEAIDAAVLEQLQQYSSDPNLIQLSAALYSRTITDEFQPSIKACIIIASKLLYRSLPPMLSTVGKTIMPDEIRLNFYCASKFLSHVI